jgi:hypothetical protein
MEVGRFEGGKLGRFEGLKVGRFEGGGLTGGVLGVRVFDHFSFKSHHFL